jgi:hypothetical protein
VSDLSQGVWVKCRHCENYWCLIHSQHVWDCPCPPIEAWNDSPYEPAPEPEERADGKT